MPVDPARTRTFTVPNAVTVARLLMAVVAARLLASPSGEFAALVLLAAAALLDAFDGWYARRFAACSAMGEHLDPLADKIVVGVLFVAVATRVDNAAVWWILGAVAAREVGMTAFRAWSRRRFRRMIPARRLGKLKMFLQSVAGIGLLASLVLPGATRPSDALVVVVMAAVLVVSWGSAVTYAHDWRAMRAAARADATRNGTVADARSARRRVAGGES